MGLLEDVSRATGMAFSAQQDTVLLLGEPTSELGASEYLAWIHGIVAGAPPVCELAKERALIDVLVESIQSGHVRSAHDCSEGGLAVALAECAISNPDAPFGATVDLTAWSGLPLRAIRPPGGLPCRSPESGRRPPSGSRCTARRYLP